MFGLRGLNPDLEITGFETAFSQIAPRLVERGHQVTIYCRRGAHTPQRRVKREHGVDLLYVPAPGGKNFSAVTSTLLATLHGLASRRYDVWFFVNVGLGHHCALARLSGRPVVMNVDGLDWTRGKWGPIARAYFRSAARSAVRFCTAIVTDAAAMQTHYRTELGRDSEMIVYGADVESSTTPALITPFGLTPQNYYLIVSRLIPENSILEMIEGFRQSKTTRRLVVVGGANYENEFHRRVRALAESDARISMTGQLVDQAVLKELWCNCYAYLHGHSVGGTNPALLRAMGYGSCVVALDTVFNREVVGEAGRFFREAATLTSLVDELDATPHLAAAFRVRAQDRISSSYRWETVVDQYEALFARVAEHAST